MEDYNLPIPQEISSHSSWLFNKRLDIVFQQVDLYKAESWAKPNIPNIESYFANLYVVFDNVFMILNEVEIVAIRDMLNNYWDTYCDVKTKEVEQNMKNTYILLFTCDNINRLLKVGLQKFAYFIRLGSAQVKRVEDALKIVNSGGGIFGGIGTVSKVPAKPSE